MSSRVIRMLGQHTLRAATVAPLRSRIGTDRAQADLQLLIDDGPTLEPDLLDQAPQLRVGRHGIRRAGHVDDRMAIEYCYEARFLQLLGQVIHDRLCDLPNIHGRQDGVAELQDLSQ
jgi:hypothetical protein